MKLSRLLLCLLKQKPRFKGEFKYFFFARFNKVPLKQLTLSKYHIEIKFISCSWRHLSCYFFKHNLHYYMSRTLLLSPLSSKMIYHSFCIDFGIGSRTFCSIVLPRHRIHTAPSGKTSFPRTTMMIFLLQRRNSNNMRTTML